MIVQLDRINSPHLKREFDPFDESVNPDVEPDNLQSINGTMKGQAPSTHRTMSLRVFRHIAVRHHHWKCNLFNSLHRPFVHLLFIVLEIVRFDIKSSLCVARIVNRTGQAQHVLLKTNTQESAYLCERVPGGLE